VIEYCYVIQRTDGPCLYLSDNGPQEVSREFLQEQLAQGFEDEQKVVLGKSTLHVMTRRPKNLDCSPGRFALQGQPNRRTSRD
jgi:hypothetical protein